MLAHMIGFDTTRKLVAWILFVHLSNMIFVSENYFRGMDSQQKDWFVAGVSMNQLVFTNHPITSTPSSERLTRRVHH